MRSRIHKNQNGILKPHMIKLSGWDGKTNFNTVKMFTTKERRKVLNNMKKGMIIAFLYVYQVYAIVATLVGHPWSTIKGFLTRNYLKGTIDNLPRCSRPGVLSQRNKQAILRTVRKDWKYTQEQIQHLHAPHVCNGVPSVTCRWLVHLSGSSRRHRFGSDSVWVSVIVSLASTWYGVLVSGSGSGSGTVGSMI